MSRPRGCLRDARKEEAIRIKKDLGLVLRLIFRPWLIVYVLGDREEDKFSCSESLGDGWQYRAIKIMMNDRAELGGDPDRIGTLM